MCRCISCFPRIANTTIAAAAIAWWAVVCPCEAVVVLTLTLKDDRDEIEMNLRLIAMYFVIVKIKQ